MELSSHSDIFPAILTAEVPTGPLPHPAKSHRKDYFLNLPNVKVFTFKMDKCNQLKFVTLKDGTPRLWRDDILMDNFIRTARSSAGSFEENFKPEKIDFESLEKRYKRAIGKNSEGEKRVNSDVRSGFFWHDTFLVKAYFTFGQRTVQSGCCHLYRTTDAPMLFYKLDEQDKRPDRLKDGRFHWHDQYEFKRFVLQPNTNYVVPEGTTYMIMTVQKTFFSIHIVSTASFLNDESWKRPIDTKVTAIHCGEKRKRKSLGNAKRAKMVDDAIQECLPNSLQQQPVAWQIGDQMVFFSNFPQVFAPDSQPLTSESTEPSASELIVPDMNSQPSASELVVPDMNSQPSASGSPDFTFLQSPAPQFPSGTSLNKMIMIEELKRQMKEIAAKLDFLQNCEEPV